MKAGRLISAVVLITLLCMPEVTSKPGAVHRFHVTYGRMAIEGNKAVCRIRFFGHDLEETLQNFGKDPSFKLDVNPESDSVYTKYFNENFVLLVNGKPIEATVISSGEEGDMWWYIMEYNTTAPLNEFRLTNTLLFDTYDDQRNIFKVITFPSEKTQSVYFTHGAENYTISF